MSKIRNRTKEHFPSVLLTLLSIVQALALELLWSRLKENTFQFELSWVSAVAGLLIASSILGVVLIWVVYASNAMRFRWVPSTSDSMYPFFIGFMQFLLIDNIDPNRTGWWLICMAVIFGVMVWVSHSTLRRARLDGDNAAYFGRFAPAKRRDFSPQFFCIGILFAGGGFLVLNPERVMLSVLMMFFVLAVLIWQLYGAARFWEESIAADTNPEEGL